MQIPVAPFPPPPVFKAPEASVRVMTDAEIRLQCLKLVLGNRQAFGCEPEVIASAEQLLAFVYGRRPGPAFVDADPRMTR